MRNYTLYTRGPGRSITNRSANYTPEMYTCKVTAPSLKVAIHLLINQKVYEERKGTGIISILTEKDVKRIHWPWPEELFPTEKENKK